MAKAKRQSLQANNTEEKPAVKNSRGGNKAEAAYDIIAMAASAGAFRRLAQSWANCPNISPP
jgi:hypothetical protein